MGLRATQGMKLSVHPDRCDEKHHEGWICVEIVDMMALQQKIINLISENRQLKEKDAAAEDVLNWARRLVVADRLPHGLASRPNARMLARHKLISAVDKFSSFMRNR